MSTSGESDHPVGGLASRRTSLASSESDNDTLTIATMTVGTGIRSRRIALHPRSECSIIIDKKGIKLIRNDKTPVWKDCPRHDDFPETTSCTVSDGITRLDIASGRTDFLVDWRGRIAKV
jgi:hypothetical protein